jgi:protein-S-isoprenylcysteine O-methyltransferase Ste14
MFPASMGKLELRVPPVALVLLFALAMWAVARWVPQATLVRPSSWVASLPALAGGLFALAGVLAFRRVHTTVNPVTPQASSSVVTTGVYRFSRNPMYLGFLLVLASFALHLGNVGSALLLPMFVAYMNRYQIRPEERALHQKFGSEYQRYTERVRRWL